MLARMEAAQPALAVTTFDPASDPAALAALAAFAAVGEAELVRGGAVVLVRGERARALALRDLEGEGGLELEARTSSASASRRRSARPGRAASTTRRSACASATATASPRRRAVELGAGGAAAARRRPRARDRRPGGRRAATRRVLIVVGPTAPFAAREARAVAYLDGGGRLFLALAPAGSGLRPRGGARGVGVATPDDVVVDPALAFELPGALRVIDGYGAHPVVAGRLSPADGGSRRGGGRARRDAAGDDHRRRRAARRADDAGPVALAIAIERGGAAGGERQRRGHDRAGGDARLGRDLFASRAWRGWPAGWAAGGPGRTATGSGSRSRPGRGGRWRRWPSARCRW
ncbi:MAG: hypothetical protein HS111_36685 [Kofleriaceae bacterium]|nr:hypothetical protein [Kofleriaceae bacterium]